MFNSVEYIREVCRQKKIPVSVLEAECGFANGYLNPKKLKKLPYDRAVKIAERLSLSVEYLLTGQEKEKAPTSEDERSSSNDVLDEVDVAFYGDYRELTEDDRATVRDMVRIMRERRAKRRGT